METLCLEAQKGPKEMARRKLTLQEALAGFAFLIWIALYLLLYRERLHLYDGFDTLEYSYASKITEAAVLFFVWAASFFALLLIPAVSRQGRIVLTGTGMVLIGVLFTTPLFGPFDLFLLTTPAGKNPFSYCSADCAVKFAPGSYHFAISDDSDSYVVYSPTGKILACSSDKISATCSALLESMGIKTYPSCRLKLNELSQGKYFMLTTFGCA
jgi:hypothetical protein